MKTTNRHLPIDLPALYRPIVAEPVKGIELT